MASRRREYKSKNARSASTEAEESPAARPATIERLGPECNVEVVLAEAVVFVVVDGEGTLDVEEGTLDVGDELDVDRVENAETKALGLGEDVTFGLMTKPRLVSVLSIKPGGLFVDVSLPDGSESRKAKFGSGDIMLRSSPSFTPIVHMWKPRLGSFARYGY